MSYHGGYAIEGPFPPRALLHDFQKGNLPLEGIKDNDGFRSDQIHAVAFSPDGNGLFTGHERRRFDFGCNFNVEAFRLALRPPFGFCE